MELTGRRVAPLAEDRYQELELWYPLLRMQEAGAEVTVVGREKDRIHVSERNYQVKAGIGVSEAQPEDFDAIIIPGGYSPDLMRRNPAMVQLVSKMYQQGKIVAAICHAGWMLASSGVAKDKRLTSTVSVKDDMVNAGVKWEDSEVVVDGNLISSRTPADLPAFLRAIIGVLAGSDQ